MPCKVDCVFAPTSLGSQRWPLSQQAGSWESIVITVVTLKWVTYNPIRRVCISEGSSSIDMFYALSQQCSPPAHLFTHAYNCMWCHPPSVLSTALQGGLVLISFETKANWSPNLVHGWATTVRRGQPQHPCIANCGLPDSAFGLFVGHCREE